MIATILQQLKTSRAVLLGLYAPAVAVLLAIGLTSLTTGEPVATFTRDPAAVTESHPATGALSNLGILGWGATVAITLFCACMLRASGGRGQPRVGFFVAAAAITLMLLLDDLFMLHEKLAEHGILRERYCFGLYLVLLGAFVASQWRRIWQTDWALLGMAFGFFAGSLFIDAMPEGILPAHHLFEDGFKFLGIVGWCAYFSRTAQGALRNALAQPDPAPAGSA